MPACLARVACEINSHATNTKMEHHEKIKVGFAPEGDYSEVMFEQKEGYFRETDIGQVTEKENKTCLVKQT